VIASRRSAARNARLEGALRVGDVTAADSDAADLAIVRFGAAFSLRCRPLADGAGGFFGGLGALDMGFIMTDWSVIFKSKITVLSPAPPLRLEASIATSMAAIRQKARPRIEPGVGIAR
jgi:hypothetical protein